MNPKEAFTRLFLGGVGLSISLYGLDQLNSVGMSGIGLLFIASVTLMFVSLFTRSIVQC